MVGEARNSREGEYEKKMNEDFHGIPCVLSMLSTLVLTRCEPIQHSKIRCPSLASQSRAGCKFKQVSLQSICARRKLPCESRMISSLVLILTLSASRCCSRASSAAGWLRFWWVCSVLNRYTGLHFRCWDIKDTRGLLLIVISTRSYSDA